MKGACERVGVGLDQVEDIVAGRGNPAHERMGVVARWAALAAGFPDSVAGVTINYIAYIAATPRHRGARTPSAKGTAC